MTTISALAPTHDAGPPAEVTTGAAVGLARRVAYTVSIGVKAHGRRARG
jgi:hypothetical protein